MAIADSVSKIVDTASRAATAARSNANNAPNNAGNDAGNDAGNNAGNNVDTEGMTRWERLKAFYQSDEFWPTMLKYGLYLAVIVTVGMAIWTHVTLMRHADEDMTIGHKIYEKTKQLEEHYHSIREDLDVFVNDPQAREVCDHSLQLQANLDTIWGQKILRTPPIGTSPVVETDP